ncbi:MAG: hypothetical protein ILM98_06585, partial [Kiritimatiellae bacterium]|nr:hypothetical protein [Kiritimatiellia bacterium]
LPARRVAEPPANADGWRRTFALYFEDPAIGYDFGVNGTDEYKIGEMIDRTAATMKFTGQDMLVYPGAWYAGIIDGETYNPRNHAQAYREAWLAKFDREGLGIMPTINQNDILLPPESITYAKIDNGSLHDSPYSIFDDGKPNPGGWHGTPPNFNVAHPAVQSALEKAVDTFIAEGRAHPSFKGVVLHLTRHSLAWFGDERAGYNDYCVAAFCRETGNVLPASLNCADPMRGQAYAEWLRADPARWEAWLDWRCRVVADLYRRLATKLRAARPDLKLMVNNFLLPDWKHPDFGSENFIPEAARRAGLDHRLLSNVPNLIVCQTEIPADYRFFGPKDPADPKDNGRFGLVRATAEPAQRELYSKCGDWTFLSGASYPWANQHDRYWESAVGNPARNGGAPTLSCDWLKECTWRVTTINPSGRSALRHYALPFRHHDVLGLSKGGFLIGTYGTEEVLLPFIRAFRALPAVPFADVSSQGDVRVRGARFGGQDYTYAINIGETVAEVRLDLPSGSRDLVSGDAPPTALRLAPYELRAFAAPSPANILPVSH